VIESELFFQSLVEDCKDIITESSFTSRWSLVEGYHQLGSRILQDEGQLTQGGTDLRKRLQDLAKYVGKRERSLYYAVEFVRLFPNLEEAPFDKTVNWYRIVNKYLTTESEEKKTLTKQDLQSIIYKIKEFLKTEYQKAKQAEYEGSPLIPNEYRKLSDYIFYLQDNIEKLEG